VGVGVGRVVPESLDALSWGLRDRDKEEWRSRRAGRRVVPFRISARDRGIPNKISWPRDDPGRN